MYVDENVNACYEKMRELYDEYLLITYEIFLQIREDL